MPHLVYWHLNFQIQVPTALLYDSDGRVIAWGLEAKYAGPRPGIIKCEWCAAEWNTWSTSMTFIYNRFKLFLEPMALRDSNAVDPRLPRLPVSMPPL